MRPCLRAGSRIVALHVETLWDPELHPWRVTNGDDVNSCRSQPIPATHESRRHILRATEPAGGCRKYYLRTILEQYGQCAFIPFRAVIVVLDLAALIAEKAVALREHDDFPAVLLCDDVERRQPVHGMRRSDQRKRPRRAAVAVDAVRSLPIGVRPIAAIRVDDGRVVLHGEHARIERNIRLPRVLKTVFERERARIVWIVDGNGPRVVLLLLDVVGRPS